ncbi:unnamed protein product, partial [Echinostoma caproni]|uniref:Mediator of RNA polymerase II transcription subunit 13 n=1 Tax=Echinostoma caproni TaxID=27848 RepID=A0A183BAY0_9TREM
MKLLGGYYGMFTPRDKIEQTMPRLGLYMELCGLAFDQSEPNNNETPNSRSLPNPTTAVEDAPFSLPDAVCPPTCWPLVGEDYGADVSNPDSNEVSSSQVLTGFLQDLGPNVMPELADLGADPIGPEADVDDFFKPHLVDRRPESTPAASLSQPTSSMLRTPPLSSIADTPTKGLGALLASPTGVATMLQATLGHTALLPTINGCNMSLESPCKQSSTRQSIREKHNSTSVLDDSVTSCITRPANPASAPPMISEFLTAPLI